MKPRHGRCYALVNLIYPAWHQAYSRHSQNVGTASLRKQAWNEPYSGHGRLLGNVLKCPERKEEG